MFRNDNSFGNNECHRYVKRIAKYIVISEQFQRGGMVEDLEAVNC